MKKDILIIANSPGGLYRFRKMLLEKLKDEGHEIHCVVPCKLLSII